MKKLYTNIGDKVCTVARICGWLGLLCAVIGAAVLLFGVIDGEDALLVVGPVLMILGLTNLIASWPLYAFGQIANDVHAMRSDLSRRAAQTRFSDLPEL